MCEGERFLFKKAQALSSQKRPGRIHKMATYLFIVGSRCVFFTQGENLVNKDK